MVWISRTHPRKAAGLAHAMPRMFPGHNGANGITDAEDLSPIPTNVLAQTQNFFQITVAIETPICPLERGVY